jgi:iron complex outermembrane receptor protein
LRNVYFGAVTDPNTVDVNGDGRIEGALLMDRLVETEHVWGGKVITDLSVAFNFTESANGA